MYQKLRFRGVGKVSIVSCRKRGSGKRESSQRSIPDFGT
jgi:hypothetical protein